MRVFILKRLTVVLKRVSRISIFPHIHSILSVEKQRNVVFLKVKNEIFIATGKEIELRQHVLKNGLSSFIWCWRVCFYMT